MNVWLTDGKKSILRKYFGISDSGTRKKYQSDPPKLIGKFLSGDPKSVYIKWKLRRLILVQEETFAKSICYTSLSPITQIPMFWESNVTSIIQLDANCKDTRRKQPGSVQKQASVCWRTPPWAVAAAAEFIPPHLSETIKFRLVVLLTGRKVKSSWRNVGSISSSFSFLLTETFLDWIDLSPALLVNLVSSLVTPSYWEKICRFSMKEIRFLNGVQWSIAIDLGPILIRAHMLSNSIILWGQEFLVPGWEGSLPTTS